MAEETTEKVVNLAELSDDEIMNLDPTTLVSEDGSKEDQKEEEKDDTDTSEPVKEPAGDQSADGDEEKNDDPDVTDGADAGDDSTDTDAGGADETSDEETDGDGAEDEADPETSGKSEEADQASSKTPEKEEKAKDSSKEVDYKAELSEALAPFKAAKRTITPKNVGELRRLAQMGVDYSRKMEAMKPYQKVLKTLEKNDLLDMEKINFMIDLDRKDPEAIKKFLKDSKIDPMDLNLEDDSTYKPTDHAVRDDELAIDDVIESIRDTETFDRTVDVITKQWDPASRKLLMDTPSVIRIINDHMEAGIYDQIADRLATERIFGKHVGLSDLDAYKAVGDAMQSEGAFGATTQTAPAAKSGNNQDSQDLNGSDDSKAQKRKSRKKAASPPKGGGAPRKKVPNFASMSDEEIENFDASTL
jgi:hypothetical protein